MVSYIRLTLKFYITGTSKLCNLNRRLHTYVPKEVDDMGGLLRHRPPLSQLGYHLVLSSAAILFYMVSEGHNPVT